MELERELKARIFMHKFAVIGAYHVEQQSKQTGEINLPLPIVQAQAIQEVPNFINFLLEQGLFEGVYEEAWNSMKDRLPNDFILNLDMISNM